MEIDVNEETNLLSHSMEFRLKSNERNTAKIHNEYANFECSIYFAEHSECGDLCVLMPTIPFYKRNAVSSAFYDLWAISNHSTSLFCVFFQSAFTLLC